MGESPKTNSLRDEFLLEPDTVFLNHGSFGATPRVVFEACQEFHVQLESQPVRFFQRQAPQLLADARRCLANYLGSDADEVVFVPNPTFAANTIARSLKLGPDDELLTTNQEYGACRFAFRFMSERRGYSIVEHELPIPRSEGQPIDSESLVEDFWRSVTPKTKAILVSHITAPTAITLPVADICKRAREAGITTFVDGAHAPGQLSFDLHQIDADFYTGACHKWMMSPKGASFLYARRDQQDRIEPLVIGWGWGDDRTIHIGSDFLDFHEWLGTHNPSPYFCVPAAIEFQDKHDWASVRAKCRVMARDVVQRAADLTGLPPICDAQWHYQMGMVELPVKTDLSTLKERLYENHRIEVPVVDWNQRKFLRVSIQGYNSQNDIDVFLNALDSELKRQVNDA